MSGIVTSIPQSKHLLELGLDPNTGDMNWWGNDALGIEYTLDLLPYKERSVFHHCLPAWTLPGLLKLMPKNTNETYHLFSSMMADQLGSWVCDRSKYYMGADGRNKRDYECFKSDNPITAAYEMVCYLLEQGLIKKGDKMIATCIETDPLQTLEVGRDYEIAQINDKFLILGINIALSKERFKEHFDVKGGQNK